MYSLKFSPSDIRIGNKGFQETPSILKERYRLDVRGCGEGGGVKMMLERSSEIDIRIWTGQSMLWGDDKHWKSF